MEGLSSICAGIGILEEDDNGNRVGYAKGEYCSDNLKDLLRFLRRDEPEKREVFKQVCKWNIAGKDLIPIIEYCQEDRSLMLNAVKILVFLTMPVEPMSIDIPQQIEYLWGLKSVITFSDAVPVIVSLLESPLENLENESFTEDDWKLVQLVLSLFRNILAIQDISTQQKVGGSASQFLSLRDRFLELLFQENVMDLILALSQHTGGSHGYLHKDNLLLLEIFHHVFRGQDPELIAKIHLKGSKVEEDAENSVISLQSIMKEEQEKRKQIRLQNLSCYSQFSGTYTRVTLDGSKALFKGNPCSASGDVLRKAHKNHRGPSKRTNWDHGEVPSTKNKILEFLYEFLSQFLMGGYNVLMQSIREDIDKEHQEIQSSDVVIFYQVAQFVTSFQYHKCVTSKPRIDVGKETSVSYTDDETMFKGSVCGPVAETLNESMFQMVISKWRYAFETLKQTNNYKFLSAAGSLVKTMIRMLDLVLKESPEDCNEPRTARILLYKLFYDQTEEGMTRFLLNLINLFDTHKQCKSDLSNLVETIHVILRLMENLQTRGTIRVSKKARKKKTKKTMTKNENVCEPSVNNPATQNETGASTCQESIDVNLLDKEKITNKDFLKEADENVSDSVEDDEPISKPANMGNTDLEMEGRIVDDNNDDLYLGTDDSSGDELLLTDEVDLKVSSLISALANNTIIQNLCWLLKFYRSNSISTNHFILCMLRRICDDLELSPMLYQLSLLKIFYEILEEQKLRPCKEYENIVLFLTSLVRRMLRIMKNYPLLAVEVLFWKTRKECHYISCGSMLNELNSMKNKNGKGSSGITDGGNGSSEGQQWVRRSIADALGDDDFEETRKESQEEDDPSEAIFQKFGQSSEEVKERNKSTLNKGIDGGEISDREGHSGEDLGRMSKGRKGLILNHELEGRLKDLYEKFKDSSDCCQLIARELDTNGNTSEKQISKALKRFGFIGPLKKKMQNSGALNELKGSNRDLPNTIQPNFTIVKESSLRKPSHSRKRVQAISVDQEQKIKELFEQFKDHRRYSYMIAGALDSTGKISAAHVSHKLKQLGLVVHKKKKSDTNLYLKDEGYSDISPEGAGESDDETLLSLRNRGKHKREGSNYGEKNKKKIAQRLSEGLSDDELLSSVLMDEYQQYNQMDAEKIDTTIANHFRDSEVETIRVDSPNAPDSKSFENADGSQNPSFDDELVDELADFDDELAHSDESTESIAKRENSVLRRRARMVIDFEEDD